MDSQIVGFIEIESKEIQRELDKIAQLEFNDTEYSEYVYGGWKNCVLRNATASYHDTTLREYEGYSKPTELAKNLDYVNSIVSKTFNLEYLKWLRIFICRQGVLLPHRDYLGMKKGFTRLHVPLQTDITCLHSEENIVFHMRVGEIWFLDATKIHSACSLSDSGRISLCLDFVPEVPIKELIKNYSIHDQGLLPKPCIIDREVLSQRDLEDILAVSNRVNEDNFAQIVESLARVHFLKQVDAIEMFAWLIEIARNSGKKKLIEEALLIKQFANGN